MHAQHDYEVNVKSELEIMQVHEKLDEMRERDWASLVDAQNRQIELLQQLLERMTGIGPSSEAERFRRKPVVTGCAWWNLPKPAATWR